MIPYFTGGVKGLPSFFFACFLRFSLANALRPHKSGAKPAILCPPREPALPAVGQPDLRRADICISRLVKRRIVWYNIR